MHDSLLKIVKQQIHLSSQDILLFKEYAEPIVYPKNRVIESEGKVPQYLYFVVSGFMRLFHYNQNGDEITTHINCPPGFITPYSDFVSQTKTDDNVECITECELLRISKANLDILTRESSAFRDFSIWVFQQSIAYNEKRAKMLATLNAEQRYRKLIDEYPEILQHVPIQYIASFLGMKPESLSRIRRQLIN